VTCVEVANIEIILTSVTPTDIVYNFIALAIIAEFDDFAQIHLSFLFGFCYRSATIAAAFTVFTAAAIAVVAVAVVAVVAVVAAATIVAAAVLVIAIVTVFATILIRVGFRFTHGPIDAAQF
jgi:hypothetical protein